MRKDTRIGVAIGLVLFAVLIVYAVVGNRTSGKKKITLDRSGKTVAPVDESSARSGAPAGDDASAASGTTGSAAAEHEQEAAAASALAGNGAVVRESTTGVKTDGTKSDPSTDATVGDSGTNWAALLSATEKVDATTHTRTPALNSGGVARRSTPSNDTATGNSATGSSVTGDFAASRGTSAALTSNTHRVEEGESFASIARTVYGDSRYTDKIREANPTIEPRRLRPGMVIRLPEKSSKAESLVAASATRTDRTTPKTAAINSAKEYAVQADDSLYKISIKLYGKADKADAIYELNKEKIGSDPGRLHPGMVLKLPQAPAPMATAAVTR